MERGFLTQLLSFHPKISNNFTIYKVQYLNIFSYSKKILEYQINHKCFSCSIQCFALRKIIIILQDLVSNVQYIHDKVFRYHLIIYNHMEFIFLYFLLCQLISYLIIYFKYEMYFFSLSMKE